MSRAAKSRGRTPALDGDDQVTAGIVYDFLRQLADRRDDGTALVYKRRGAWRTLTWRAVASRVTRLSHGLTDEGLVAGRSLLVAGTISARLLLLVTAAYALGARVVSVSSSASPKEFLKLLKTYDVAVVAVQSRETVSDLLALRGKGFSPVIVLDHVTPENRTPAPGVVALSSLLGESVAAAGFWRGARATSRPRSLLWFEDSSDWPDGLDLLVRRWLGQQQPVALPETLQSAARDRRELQPEAWLASRGRLEALGQELEVRRPRAGLQARLVTAALEGRDALWKTVLRGRLRSLLGLRNLKPASLHTDESGLEVLSRNRLLGGFGGSEANGRERSGGKGRAGVTIDPAPVAAS